MLDVARLGMEVDTSDVKNASRDLDRFSRDGKQAAGQAERVGKSGRSMAGGMRTAATAIASVVAAAAALTGAVRTIASFEKQISTVGAISRATADELAAMRDVASELGSTTEFSATQAAQGLEFLSRAGFSASESVTAIPAVLDLATASAMGLGQAADISSNIMSAFGIAAENTASATDILAAASSRANTDVGQLGSAMSFVGPVASSLDIAMSDAAAAIGVLSDAGIQGTRAGTGLRRVLSSLANPTGQAADALQAMGLQLEDLNPQTNDVADVVERLAGAGLSAADALTIFGDRGGPAVLALTSQTGRLRELTGELANVEGEAARMAETMRDNLGGDIDSLFSSIQGLVLAMGEAGLTAVLRVGVQILTDFTRSLSGFVSAVSSAASAINDFLSSTSDAETASRLMENALDNTSIATGDLMRASQLLARQIESGSVVTIDAVRAQLEEAKARREQIKLLEEERIARALNTDEFQNMVTRAARAREAMDAIAAPGTDVDQISLRQRAAFQEAEQSLLVAVQRQQEFIKSLRSGVTLTEEEAAALDQIEVNISNLEAKMGQFNQENEQGVQLTERIRFAAGQITFAGATESARALAAQLGVGLDKAVGMNNALNAAAGIQGSEPTTLGFGAGVPDGSTPGGFVASGGHLGFGDNPGAVRVEDFIPDNISSAAGSAARSVDELTEAARAAQQILGQVNRESVTYADVINELSTALNGGKISQEQFSDAVDIAGQKFKDLSSQGGQLAQSITDPLKEAFRSGELNAKSFADAVQGVLERLRDRLIDQVFKPIEDAIAKAFSGSGGSSGGGGILGNIFGGLLGGGASASAGQQAFGIASSFLGPMDSGGTIGRGQSALVGERRPEIVSGPATVTGGADTARMMGGGVVNNITVNAPPGSEVREERTRNASGGEDLKIMIDKAVSGLARDPRSDLSRALQGTFGISQTTRGR